MVSGLTIQVQVRGRGGGKSSQQTKKDAEAKKRVKKEELLKVWKGIQEKPIKIEVYRELSFVMKLNETATKLMTYNNTPMDDICMYVHVYKPLPRNPNTAKS